jgi:hypothetical protein
MQASMIICSETFISVASVGVGLKVFEMFGWELLDDEVDAKDDDDDDDDDDDGNEEEGEEEHDEEFVVQVVLVVVVELEGDTLDAFEVELAVDFAALRALLSFLPILRGGRVSRDDGKTQAASANEWRRREGMKGGEVKE